MELKIDRIQVQIEIKSIQKLETFSKILVMGTANGMYAEAVTDVLKKILAKAGDAMVKKDASRWSRFKYGDGFLVDFELVAEYADYAPYIPRADGESTSSWKKKMFQIEYKPFDHEELWEC